MQIVAATDFSTRSSRALRQAGLLARLAGLAILTIVPAGRLPDYHPEDMPAGSSPQRRP